MLSINTNLSSLIAQNSMNSATNKLNQAIERMTTGAKINHAKDNAANYSIATNMTTKMNSYMVAEDNVAMGLDMVATISENLDLVNNHVRRIRDLAEQAANGTYGEESLKAIQAEIDSRLAEISRLKSTTEFNGIKLLEVESSELPMYVTGSFIEEIDQLTEEEAIAQGYTIIKTADDLQAMQDNLSGKYILMNDIDLAGYNWTPVGSSSNRFTGELNGNGFVVRNLTINKPPEDNIGLFGYAEGATIKNLGIEDANVSAESNVGILVGSLYGGIVENCYTTGNILSNGGSGVGGLIGYAFSGAEIKNCYSNIDIQTTSSTVGGLVGAACDVGGANFYNCYSSGNVKGTESVGGLIGYLEYNADDCYTNCTVQGNSYVGSLLGSCNGTPNECYFDIEKTGIATGVGHGNEIGIQGVTSAELQALIDNGILPRAKAPAAPLVEKSITLQVGTNGDANSQIAFNLATTLAQLEIIITDSASARDNLTILDNYLAQISDYQTSFGAITNRLESALDEISIQYENLASSRSTLRDADIAEESSQYIQAQILQQASATLMATANQSPAIALQLI